MRKLFAGRRCGALPIQPTVGSAGRSSTAVVRSVLVLMSVPLAVACVDAETSAALDAKNVAAYSDEGSGPAPTWVFGWGLDVSEGVVRWNECADETHCTRVERERGLGAVRAASPVGTGALADGTPVTVLRLSVVDPAYVGPATP